MNKLDNLLKELGISKVKLAKYLGVSRQMIYNYLELNDVDKWPKDKKILLFNLLGVKSKKELNDLKIDTDYIMSVDARINSVFDGVKEVFNESNNEIYDGLTKDNQELLFNIINLIKENLEDNEAEGVAGMKYLYYYLQALNSSRELKYFLAYAAKATASVKPLEFAFNEKEQFVFEGIMFQAMKIFSSGQASSSKIPAVHQQFVDYINQKREEKLGRTKELFALRERALKELGYSEINESNSSEVLMKIAEIESRTIV
jgi:transcriptional regulator with XRE-family HTH domain